MIEDKITKYTRYELGKYPKEVINNLWVGTIIAIIKEVLLKLIKDRDHNIRDSNFSLRDETYLLIHNTKCRVFSKEGVLYNLSYFTNIISQANEYLIENEELIKGKFNQNQIKQQKN